MTKPLYDQPPAADAADDGAFYPLHPDFYHFNDMDTAPRRRRLVSMLRGSRQPAGPAPATRLPGYPPGWDYGLIGVEMPYPPLSTGTVRGEGDGLQPQSP